MLNGAARINYIGKNWFLTDKEDFPVGFMNFMDFLGGFLINYPEAKINLPEVKVVQYKHKFIRSVYGEDTGTGVYKFFTQGV